MAEEQFRIEHRIVGGLHMFTSPDLPELCVAHRDVQTAAADVQPAVNAILSVKRHGYRAVPKVLEVEEVLS